MGLTVHFEVLNQLGTPMLYSSTLATRPPAGIKGRIFYRTDSPFGIYRDNGVTWDLISSVGTSGAVTGSGTATQVAYWDTSSSITSNSGLYYDAVNIRLGINNATPGAALDAHQAGGTIIQANSTTLSNSLMSFQLQGTGKWQIGNVYSTGTNYFRVYDQLNSVERIRQYNTGELDQTGWIVNTNTVTGITGTVTTQTPNSSFSNNFTYNSGITTVPSANLIGVDVDNNVNFSGANTIDQTSYNTAALLRTIMTFGSAAASITYTQAAGGIRALTNKQSIYIQQGANSGTISHFSNLQIFGDQALGAGKTTFTNRYQILLNDYDDFTAGNTYTNRWAIYQAGALNTNYFAGKILTGTSTTVGTYQLDVTGTSQFIGNMYQNSGNFIGTSSHITAINFAGGTSTDNATLGFNNVQVNSGTSGLSQVGLISSTFLDSTSVSAAGIQALYGNYQTVTGRALSTGTQLTIIGSYLSVNRNDASDVSTNANNNMTGYYAALVHANGTAISASNIQNFYATSSVRSGTVTSQYGLRIVNNVGNSTTAQSTTITNWYGVNVVSSLGNASSGQPAVITNYYGMYLTTPTLFGSGSITNRWSLYSQDPLTNMVHFGSVVVGSSTITASAQMSVVSTTKGFLPPVMTTAQKNAISTPVAGLIVFDTTLAKLCVYSGSAWQTITSV